VTIIQTPLESLGQHLFAIGIFGLFATPALLGQKARRPEKAPRTSTLCRTIPLLLPDGILFALSLPSGKHIKTKGGTGRESAKLRKCHEFVILRPQGLGAHGN
jgi:hypothetical protein